MAEAQPHKISLFESIQPEPELTVTEWADAHRILPKKASAEPGKYRSSRTPYLREIMDNLSPSSPVIEQCCMKGTQLGLTTTGENWFGYVVDQTPGPMMMVFPTVDLARDHSKQKLTPTIEEMPKLRDKIKVGRTRESGNTILVKEFPGGMAFLIGSNSGAGFRQRSIRFLFCDDIDGYELDVAGEGDPVTLAKKRTDTYPTRKKIFLISTPTVKGISRIEKAYYESDQRQYYIPCPHCDEMQVLEWGGRGADRGIKFTRDENGRVIDAWYECCACHTRIDEHHKVEMLERGEWRPAHPYRIKRGYQLSSLYSPLGWVSWLQVAEEFLEAKNDPERLKVWVNTRLGLPFESEGAQPDWVVLKARAEPYPILSVPKKKLILTAGVDVQDNRLAVVIRAWGQGEESWLVWWGELYGDTAQLEVWEQLDELFERDYSGLHIISMAVDSGGHRTTEVYNYCRARGPRVIAIKGAAQMGKPVIGRPSQQDVTWMGQVIKNGVQLWPVGSDTAKAMIYSRLRIKTSGPGCYHWPIGLPDEYYLQLTAERLITRYVRGYPKPEWVKTGPRNEALDAEIYAYAAALRAGMAHIDWEKISSAAGGRTRPSRMSKEEIEVSRTGIRERIAGSDFERPGWLNR